MKTQPGKSFFPKPKKLQMSTPLRILLADDHAVLLESISDRLEREEDFEVVSRVHTADDAVRLAQELKPDVVVLDIDLPGQASFDAARQIKTDKPETHVIYLSAFSNDRYIEDALQSGCSGYLTKDESMETVITAIRSAVTNGAYYSPKVRERLVVDPEKGLTLEGAGATKASSLSARELEVLRYLAQGMSKKEVATKLHRSIKTIDKHVENLMRKLEIHDRVELARYAIREGLIEP
jgi:DNA-binding NarL/FixJ family response regulator